MSMNEIIKARHYSPDQTARGYIRKSQQDIKRQRGIAVTIKDMDKEPTGAPVNARVWNGQWIADCECNGASFVDPAEPIFFCFSCGNMTNGSKPRPVIFPDEWQAIEQKLIERPIKAVTGLTDLERIGTAKPELFVQLKKELQDGSIEISTVGLGRDWNPGESLDDLHAQQHEAISEWQKRGRA
jgi:hypothetical protein